MAEIQLIENCSLKFPSRFVTMIDSLHRVMLDTAHSLRYVISTNTEITFTNKIRSHSIRVKLDTKQFRIFHLPDFNPKT
jgi:hypothetical protein